MRMTYAWAKTASENQFLKILVFALSAVILSLALLCFVLTIEPPLIVERDSTNGTTIANTGDSERTETEIKNFVKLSLSARFDTKNTDDLHYLSEIERRRRAKEIDTLSRQEMLQRVIVDHDNIKLEKGAITVLSDRLISVQNIRSAFLLPLKVKLTTVQRSKINPYGLILENVSEFKLPKAKKE